MRELLKVGLKKFYRRGLRREGGASFIGKGSNHLSESPSLGIVTDLMSNCKYG